MSWKCMAACLGLTVNVTVCVCTVYALHILVLYKCVCVEGELVYGNIYTMVARTVT